MKKRGKHLSWVCHQSVTAQQRNSNNAVGATGTTLAHLQASNHHGWGFIETSWHWNWRDCEAPLYGSTLKSQERFSFEKGGEYWPPLRRRYYNNKGNRATSTKWNRNSHRGHRRRAPGQPGHPGSGTIYTAAKLEEAVSNGRRYEQLQCRRYTWGWECEGGGDVLVEGFNIIIMRCEV